MSDRSHIFPILGLSFLLSSYIFAGHLDHRLGLRWAKKIDATKIELVFGASFVPKIGAQGKTYRVVSPTDPDFRNGQRGITAQVTAREDGGGLEDVRHDRSTTKGWQGRRFQKRLVVVALPRPMKDGHRYFAQAMGVNHQPVTGGRAAHWIMPADATPPAGAIRNRLGLRLIEIVS
ncbi:MAG: hypothetical protein QF886_25890, partial [Planctomycetota bacterium]|nr:hypothetical protein [Planctomycetota bacterium]